MCRLYRYVEQRIRIEEKWRDKDGQSLIGAVMSSGDSANSGTDILGHR